jgi:uncharacterized membrane protein YuzA (DUF378 family)
MNKYFSLDAAALYLLIIGGLNAGVSAVFSYDALGQVMSGNIATAFYALVGLAAVYAVIDRMGWLGSEG